MAIKIVAGIVIGGLLGFGLGLLGKCSTRTCPLTGNPISGAIFGALIGFMIVYSVACGGGYQRAGWDSPHTVNIESKSQFDTLIKESSKPILVDFYATWCGPCKMMLPTVNEIAKETQEQAIVAKVNTDKQSELAQIYQIEGIPTFILFNKGSAIGKWSGVQSKETLLNAINQAL